MIMTSPRYIETVGRRKTASARVRLTPWNATTVTVNERSLDQYFPYTTLQNVVTEVLKTEGAGIGDYTITAKVTGGGISAQAEAIRLGIARALLKEDPDRRMALKEKGYFKRDARAVERKKPGLKKARKSPQWSKR